MNNYQKKTINNINRVLKTINREDYEIPQVNFVENKINTFQDRYSTYENNFVAKFNEKYAIAVLKTDIPYLEGLQRQLQITKRYIFSDHEDIRIEENYFKLANRYGERTNNSFEFEMIPDFFIHKDQTDKASENQKLIIEFKTENNVPENRFMWDLFKLNVYLEKYNFQTACFVSINSTIERIEDFIIDYFENKYYLSQYQDRLHFIIQENYDAEIKSFSYLEFAEKYGLSY